MTIRLMAVYIALLFGLTACATYPENPQLSEVNREAGYRFGVLPENGNTESLFVILTFSGGGTRAAALSYGVLEKLDKTIIHWNGHEKTLLDEVDVISSVSGGSFTAAYFGLHRREIFAKQDGFEDRFLYRNIQGDLFRKLFNPVNWLRLASPTFGRIDLASEFYDQEIFDGAVYADLAERGRPFIMVNATDMSRGAHFAFIQEQFDPICSDLSEFKVARAVAASSNFPVAFTPLTLNNYAGNCKFKERPWVRMAAKDSAFWDNPRRFNRARVLRTYAGTEGPDQQITTKPYIHLLDGGVSDNIGLRGPLTAIESNDLPWSIPNKINNGEIEKLVVIIVDARTAPETHFDEKAAPPNLVTVLETTATVPLDNYSFDTVERLRNTFDAWRKDRRNLWRNSDDAFRACPPPPDQRGPRDLKPLDLYAIYVGFDQIHDPEKRHYFLNLPTSLNLSRGEVNDLIKIAGVLMEQSDQFPALRRCLQ
jgi:NTE family protein